MLQEQAQLLQNLIGSLTDALKAVNTRLDQQAEVNRKAFADQKLVIDNLTNDVRVIREKLDDNNVRIGSLTQEVDALRQAMQQLSARPSATDDRRRRIPAAPDGDAGRPAGRRASPVGTSPQKMLDAARADYFAGQYDLAILGFDGLRQELSEIGHGRRCAGQHLQLVCRDGKNDKAVEACDIAIRNYPDGDAIPEAYYQKGLALSTLKDARRRARGVGRRRQEISRDQEAELAKQGLERLKRPDLPVTP